MTPEMARERIDRARQAGLAWADVPAGERARRLGRFADTLMDRRAEVSRLVQDENGKPEVEALLHDVGVALATCRWLCRAGPGLLQPRRVPMAWMPVRRATLRRQAFGVVLVISPWNFPLSIPASGVLAALMAGNAVLLKPSEVTPRCGALLAELLEPCGLPEGVFQVVQGDGAAGAALLAARPDKVVFTGSSATGRKVMAAAAAHPIPVTLELGGVDALVVLADADLELAASAIAWGGTVNAGQVCASVERVLAHRDVAEALAQRVLDKWKRLDPRRDLGRVTAERQRAVYDAHIEDARARGLAVRCGGRWVDGDRYAPTWVDGAGVEASRVWREETFGPVVAMRPFDTDDEAIRFHDEVGFGLTASVFGGDLKAARALALRLRAGVVSVNEVAASLYGHAELPWGGVGDSGFGRAHGSEGLLDMTWAQVLEEPLHGGFIPKRPWWHPYDFRHGDLVDSLVSAQGRRDTWGVVADLGRAAGRLGALVTRSPRT